MRNTCKTQCKMAYDCDSTVFALVILSNTTLYDNKLTSIIDIYFYETFSTITQTFSACAQLFRHPV